MITLKSLRLIILLLLSLIVFACQSQANLARSLVNESCSNLGIPNEIIVGKGERITAKGIAYILEDRYLYSLSYSAKLSECITAYTCSQKWSDYQNECNKQRSLFWEAIWGKSSCNAVKPTC